MLILAASLSIFVYGMTAAMLGTILPDLSARFHLTPKQNGTIAFCQALGLILASIGVGPLIDYEGKKVGLVSGPGPQRAGGSAASPIQRFSSHCILSVLARHRRRSHRYRGQCSRQRCRPGPPRHGAESSEYLFRARVDSRLHSFQRICSARIPRGCAI